MNKHITPNEIDRAMVEAERDMLMWEYQSPTILATNPHEPKGDVHHPRLKGPYVNTKTLAERAKDWPRRNFDGSKYDISARTITLPDGKKSMVFSGQEANPRYMSSTYQYKKPG